MTRVILIEIHGDGTGGGYTVHEGDRFCDRLAWDEMLGTVAELTHPSIGKARYRMETAEQHAERQRAHRERLAEMARRAVQHGRL